VISRREFFQASLASALIFGSNASNRAYAQQKLSQDKLLDFKKIGNVTLIHITDIHGQLKPTYFREPEVNLGMGSLSNLPPHITGKMFLEYFQIPKNSAYAYALSSENFTD
jgi:sulfur-oxidizing protein SoxB